MINRTVSRSPIVRMAQGLLLFGLLASFTVITSSLAEKPHQIPPHSPKTHQTATGGFWRTDRNFDAMLRIKNILIAMPLTVTPVIYMADGTEIHLKPIQLEPAGAISINIANAIRDSGVELGAHRSSYGMAEVKYQWGWAAVAATIQDIDEIESITFHSSLTANLKNIQDPDAAAGSRTIKGLWWLPNTKAGGFIALQNPSMQSIDAQVKLAAASGGPLVTRSVTVSSHSTVQFDLADLLSSVNDVDATGTTTITYKGVEHSLTAVEGIEDRSVGYSATPNLVEIAPPPTDTTPALHDLAAPGVMIGAPDPVMLFPSSTSFSPYAFLQNLSLSQLNIQMFATAKDGTELNAGFLSIPPGGSAQADLSKVSLQMDGNRYTNLVFRYFGFLGDLNVEAGSVDQTRNYVFEVGAGPESTSFSRTICYWTINGDTDTMMTIWNFTGQPQDELLTLYFSAGKYKIPFHLEPGATKNLTLHDIQRSQERDIDGNVIPANIVEGSALLSSAAGEFEPMSVAAASASFNVRNGTCGQNCLTCNGVTSFVLSPNPATLSVQGQVQMHGTLTMNTGSTESITSGTWKSSASTVATVGSSGMVTGVAAGAATITDELFNMPVNAGYVCFGYNISSCPTSPIQGSSPANVQIPTSDPVVQTLNYGPRVCPANQSGPQRVVLRQIDDQNVTPILVANQQINEQVNPVPGKNGLNFLVMTSNALTDNQGETFDTFGFCSPLCPNSTATSTFSQTVEDVWNGITYPVGQYTIQFSCTQVSVNGRFTP